jgi:hypothetical protein
VDESLKRTAETGNAARRESECVLQYTALREVDIGALGHVKASNGSAYVTSVEGIAANVGRKKLSTSRVGVKKKLQRLSTVGRHWPRRLGDTTLKECLMWSAFSLCF